MGFDDAVYRDMVALARHTTWLNGAASGWSDYGLVLFLVLAAAGLWRTRSLPRALWVPAAMAVAAVLGTLLKLAVGERRPCRTLPAGHLVAACPPLGDYAFPSNHAVLAGAGAAAVWALDRRLGVVAAVNALVIAVARVYIGVHYPHDVAAGLLCGALVAWPGGRPGRWVLGHALSRLGGSPSGDPAGGSWHTEDRSSGTWRSAWLRAGDGPRVRSKPRSWRSSRGPGVH
ncbi:phosphatase PAP2 family protein [Actinomadura sp. DC4]|uniref:phosphatase PAP2 family protein n=1 Tax=Actinomadura sp. DC4 TaxID=3055069 RepID=UPI0025B1C2BB|nr:phosphatase PAP2 family protein [Actinomadura sp. DC4]MDN3355033.1 phosphatase PAP2 family protein [Actinomadura sp. DC4]